MTERRNPPPHGDEVTLLRGFLDHHRDTLRLKTEGLDTAQLSTSLPPSTMTLGGLLKHLAFVEDHWFGYVLSGRPRAEPWRDMDWAADPDGDWVSAASQSPTALRTTYDAAVAASDAILDEVLGSDDLDQVAVRPRRQGGGASLRWILLHMLGEYARHNGHADLIRESLDGETGA